MARKHKLDPKQVEPGTVVEATNGDLGEADVTKPKVANVVEDQDGNVEKLVVEKGVIFKKKLEVPAERVQSVDSAPSDEGKVTINMNTEEVQGLTAVGTQELPDETEDNDNLLEEVEKNIPTAEGLRKLEAARQEMRQGSKDVRLDEQVEKPGPWLPGEAPQQASKELEKQQTAPSLKRPNFLLRVLGPGFLAGMSGNDSSAVTAYAVDGATTGYGHLWLMLLSTPLYQAIQFACAKIGRITQMGFSELLRKHYSPLFAVPASLILIIANVALIAADLVAIGTSLELMTGLSWLWFVFPAAAILWYLTVFRNFESIKKIFMVMSFAFAAYIITAIFSHANWGEVLINTFVPHLNFTFASISSAVALLGATFSPYSMFWQVQGEKEERRPGSIKQQVRIAAVDVGIGAIGGNLIAYFIIICTATTIFMHHGQITTAADAARSLEPLVGPLAKYLFAIGLLGAGIVAIPILLASTSYAVAGTFGWPAGLSKKPWQNEGFYLILTGALVVSLVLAFLRLNPIQLIFWANVLSGVLAPILVIYLIIVGNNRTIMGKHRLGIITTIGLVLAALILIVATVLLFYGLATGQSS